MVTTSLISSIFFGLFFEATIAVLVIVILVIVLRQDKRIILANVLLGLLYVLYSLYLWATINSWVRLDVVTEWSPLTVRPVFDLMIPKHSLPLVVSERFNIPFILFWVLLAVNIRFIIKKYHVMPRSNQLKLMILVNALLSLLYVFSNYALWSSVNQWIDLGLGSEWSPISITPVNLAQPAISPSVQPLLNIPFMLFLVLLAANLYFIIKLQRSKETKQNPS